MNKLQSLVLAITLLVGSVSVATAQDFKKGLEATQSGDFETAVQEWRPLPDLNYPHYQQVLPKGQLTTC